MKRTVFYAINGILTKPGEATNWTTRLNSWVIRHMPDGVVSNRYEYASDILFRNVNQRRRADEISTEVGKYRRAGYRIVLVGHSNGCALIGEVLNSCGQEIESAHLFAPAATDEAFAEAIREGMLQRLHIYGSKNDKALKAAKLLGPVAKLFPWTGAYGSLGLRGKEFAAKFPQIVTDHSNDSFGHSTWWQAGTIFNDTMDQIRRNDAADIKLLEGPPTEHLP